jgi:uncharacterized protein YbjT (DUF2867 family)
MIVLTTPTGQIGSQVLGNLLDSGEELRVIVRDPAQLPADVRDSLDIVEGSHGDAAVVDKAFSGADAVFWLAPPDPHALRLKPPSSASHDRLPRPSRGTTSGASSQYPPSAAARPGPAGPVTSPARSRWTT